MKRRWRTEDGIEYCDVPMLTCPHCGHGWQWDDYYEVEAGDTVECPGCEKTIHILSVDTRISVVLSTEPEG